MTTLRKWRFPILIGSGLIAAAALVYFSHGHIGTDKTQGAIGKRDVYRDAQVASADVATPGSAPVATAAVLQSSEFKELAKNPAFQQLVNDSDFNQLTHDAAFFGVLADENFRVLAQDPLFSKLLSSTFFQKELTNNVRDGVNRDKIFESLHHDPEFVRFANSKPLKNLLENRAFAGLVPLRSFQDLVATNALRQTMSFPAFYGLIFRSDFQNALKDGSMQRLKDGSMQRLMKDGSMQRLKDGSMQQMTFGTSGGGSGDGVDRMPTH
jgi:hypothetical protein